MFRSSKPESPKPDFESFTLFDSKSRLYREPMLAVSQDDMVRQIVNLFRDPAQSQNVLVTNPEDFSLFKIGTFCKRSGNFESCNHEHIANLHDLAASVPKTRPALEPVGIEPT